MNNYITPTHTTIYNTTAVQNGTYSINNIVSNDLSSRPMCNDFINDITKSTFGTPQPGRTVIGVCNYGDGYIYID